MLLLLYPHCTGERVSTSDGHDAVEKRNIFASVGNKNPA
jgi:hypothetical protein